MSVLKLVILVPAYVVMGATFFAGALLGPTLVFLVPFLFLPMAGLVSGARILADALDAGEPVPFVSEGLAFSEDLKRLRAPWPVRSPSKHRTLHRAPQSEAQLIRLSVDNVPGKL